MASQQCNARRKRKPRRKRKSNPKYSYHRGTTLRKYGFSPEFVETMGLLRRRRRKGVYSFWAEGICLYVGRSAQLCSRIANSFQERFDMTTCGPIYLRMLLTSTKTDMAVAEVVLIALEKPTLNDKCKFADKLTDRIQITMPKLGAPILCNSGTPTAKPTKKPWHNRKPKAKPVDDPHVSFDDMRAALPAHITQAVDSPKVRHYRLTVPA